MLHICMTTFYQVAEMRKLRAYAQMDKQKAVRDMEERLKKEHAHEITSLRTLLRNGGNYPAQRARDGAPEQVWCQKWYTMNMSIYNNTLCYRCVWGVAPPIKSKGVWQGRRTPTTNWPIISSPPLTLSASWKSAHSDRTLRWAQCDNH